jgi:hypothetical protein
MSFYKKGINKGKRKGSPRIVNKRSWLKRSSYSLRLAVGLLSGGSLWKNDGSGAIDNPWDNSKFWNN